MMMSKSRKRSQDKVFQTYGKRYAVVKVTDDIWQLWRLRGNKILTELEARGFRPMVFLHERYWPMVGIVLEHSEFKPIGEGQELPEVKLEEVLQGYEIR